MTKARKIQLEVAVTDRTQAGLSSAKNSVAQFSQETARATERAANSFQNIGEAAAKAQKKVDASTRSLIALIQRLSAEAQAGGKNTEAYVLALAQQRGIKPEVLEPYLKVLREARAAQDAAAQSMHTMGLTAKQTAAALRQVPMQLTDIVVSLAGGQSVMQVFLQQGGQLRDIFGSAGAAAQALGRHVVGLITPLNVGLAAVGALGAALYSAQKQAQELSNALVLTGGAAGVSAGQLSQIAAAIDTVAGTQSHAAETLVEFVRAGIQGREALQEFAAAAIRFEQATGQAVETTAKQFAALAKEPLRASLELNESMNYLTASTYEQIKALMEQGRVTEAARVAQEAFAEAIDSRASQVDANLNLFARGWREIASAVKEAWDEVVHWLDGVAGIRNPYRDLEAARKHLAIYLEEAKRSPLNQFLYQDQINATKERIRVLEEQIQKEEEIAAQQRAQADMVKARAKFDEEGLKFLSQREKMEREIAAATELALRAGVSREELERRIAAIRASYEKPGRGASVGSEENRELRERTKLLNQLAGITDDYYEQLARIQAMRREGLITDQQQIQLLDELTKRQPFAIKQAKELAAAEAERKKQLDAVWNAVHATEQRAKAQEQANAVFGQGKAALAELTLAELEQQRAAMETATNVIPGYIEALDARIAAQRRLVAALKAHEVKEAAAESAQQAQREWERTAENIERSLTDALMRGFESGKDFARNLRDAIVNMFQTLVLRPIIQAIVMPVAGGLAGAFSMTGTANATQAVQSLTGGNGGFNLSSLSSLVQPGSMLSKIPGMNAVTGLLATQLPGTTMLSGGAMSLAAGGTAGGPVASLAAAENLAGLTGSGLTIGAALGMGALGGLGYSLLGGSLGLPQNQYSGITSSLGGALGAWGGSALAGTSAGAALGATAGSVLPVVGTAAGAILGGLASSLFGGDEQSPSVIFNAQRIRWGDIDAERIGGGNFRAGFEFHTKDGADYDAGEKIAAALEQVAAQQFAEVETAVGAFGDKYVDMLRETTIEFGRKVAGAGGGAWDFGSDMELDELLAKYSDGLRKAILEAAEDAFLAAGTDLVSSSTYAEALALVAGRAEEAIKGLQETISAGVQSGDVEAYAAALQQLSATIKTITATWEQISRAADDLVQPPTAYEAAVRQANAQFDDWVSTLQKLGFAQERIEEIEAKRAATLARLDREMGPIADAEAASKDAIAKAEAAVETARKNLIDAYEREADELRQTKERWEQFAKSLKQWRESVLTGRQSPLSPSAQRELVSQRYQDVLLRSRIGDIAAIEELQDVAAEQLAIQLETAETEEDYARTAMRTLAEVESVEQLATRQASAAERQLEALQQQVSQLIEINQSVLSVKDAIAALQAASAARAAAQASAAATQNAVSNGGFDPAAYLRNKTEQVNMIGYQGRTDWTVQQVQQAMADAGMTPWEHYLRYGIAEGVRGYASGGMHPGGLRLVGEEGPELEVTGPARIWSARETKEILAGGAATSEEVRALREELRAIGSALARNTMETAQLLRRWDGDGMPEVRSVA